MIEITTTSIPNSFAELEEAARKAKDIVPRLQIDVVDGIFAPSITWPYNGTDADKFRALVTQEEGLPYWELLNFEVDMMVTEPESKIDDWINAGVDTLIIHRESTEKIEDILARAAERGIAVALALKPSTDIELLAPWVERLSFVQCMGNDKIGYHGVALDESVYGKIEAIKQRWNDLVVGIDIGVNTATVAKLASVGVTRFAAGSAILGSDNPKAAVQELRQLIESV
jgi:ribulose-phosphate 3-epimerase